MQKECILYDKLCTKCGECMMCDLDPGKECDDCGKCLEEEKNFRSLNLKEFFRRQGKGEEYKK